LQEIYLGTHLDFPPIIRHLDNNCPNLRRLALQRGLIPIFSFFYDDISRLMTRLTHLSLCGRFDTEPETMKDMVALRDILHKVAGHISITHLLLNFDFDARIRHPSPALLHLFIEILALLRPTLKCFRVHYDYIMHLVAGPLRCCEPFQELQIFGWMEKPEKDQVVRLLNITVGGNLYIGVHENKLRCIFQEDECCIVDFLKPEYFPHGLHPKVFAHCFQPYHRKLQLDAFLDSYAKGEFPFLPAPAAVAPYLPEIHFWERAADKFTAKQFRRAVQIFGQPYADSYAATRAALHRKFDTVEEMLDCLEEYGLLGDEHELSLIGRDYSGTITVCDSIGKLNVSALLRLLPAETICRLLRHTSDINGSSSVMELISWNQEQLEEIEDAFPGLNAHIITDPRNIACLFEANSPHALLPILRRVVAATENLRTFPAVCSGAVLSYAVKWLYEEEDKEADDAYELLDYWLRLLASLEDHEPAFFLPVDENYQLMHPPMITLFDDSENSAAIPPAAGRVLVQFGAAILRQMQTFNIDDGQLKKAISFVLSFLKWHARNDATDDQISQEDWKTIFDELMTPMTHFVLSRRLAVANDFFDEILDGSAELRKDAADKLHSLCEILYFHEENPQLHQCHLTYMATSLRDSLLQVKQEDWTRLRRYIPRWLDLLTAAHLNAKGSNGNNLMCTLLDKDMQDKLPDMPNLIFTLVEKGGRLPVSKSNRTPVDLFPYFGKVEEDSLDVQFVEIYFFALRQFHQHD
jgi:hypothetical protein